MCPEPACAPIPVTRSSSVQGLEEVFAGSLGGGCLLGGSLLLGPDELLTTKSLGVRVEPEQDGLVPERVLLLGEGPLLGSGTTSSDDGLDFVRVDESGDIGRGDLGSGEPAMG